MSVSAGFRSRNVLSRRFSASASVSTVMNAGTAIVAVSDGGSIFRFGK